MPSSLSIPGFGEQSSTSTAFVISETLNISRSASSLQTKELQPVSPSLYGSYSLRSFSSVVLLCTFPGSTYCVFLEMTREADCSRCTRSQNPSIMMLLSGALKTPSQQCPALISWPFWLPLHSWCMVLHRCKWWLQVLCCQLELSGPPLGYGA